MNNQNIVPVLSKHGYFVCCERIKQATVRKIAYRQNTSEMIILKYAREVIMKKKFICFILVVAVCALALTACYGDKNYLKDVNAYGFWDNDAATSIAQPSIGQYVRDFLSSPSVDNKPKKVAFIGYDGCRADALINVLATPGWEEGTGDTSPYSGIAELLKTQGAGIYLAYAGGSKGGENEQHTSTAPGWAALTSGEWGIVNGVTDNGMYKSIDYKTFMLEAAIGEFGEKYRSAFAASWQEHFVKTYLSEVEYLRENSDVEKKEINADSNYEEVSAYLDAVSASSTVDMDFKFVKDDAALHEYLLSCVEEGGNNERDVIFGIYEATDHSGHDTGFGNDNYRYIKGFRDEDSRCYQLLRAIYSRPSFENEDWLIIITADHGGIQTWHGGQTLEERTTWIVCNKGVPEKYFSSGYDGYAVSE